MDGLEHGIPISMGVKVIKGVDVDTVEAFSGMSFRNRILLGDPLFGNEKGKGGTISGKEPDVRGGFQWEFPAPGKILMGIGQVRGNVGSDIEESISEHEFD